MNDNYNLEILTLQKMNKKIAKSDINAIDLENKIYTKNNTILNEKEKIYFEIRRIMNKLKSLDNIEENDINLDDMLNNLFKKFRDARDNEFNNCIDLKKQIMKIQIYLNMKVGFYSVVKEMLEEEFDNKEVKR